MKKFKLKNIYIWRYLCVLLSSLVIFLFWKNTLLTSLILILFAILINIKAKIYDVTYFVVISIFATIVESLTNSSGAWVYSNQNILNFPYWLPLYWGMGGVVTKDTYLILKDILKR
jgi:hypothetical protein